MIALILLLLFESMIAQSAKIRYCTQAEEMQCTRWGWISGISDRRSIPIKVLRGRVFVPVNEPLDGVLVEIYEFAPMDGKPLESFRVRDCRKRLAACITNKTGKFYFELPSGVYEVRASKEEWCTPSVLVTIDTKKGKRIATDIEIEIGL
jgi:hypothetical protein